MGKWQQEIDNRVKGLSEKKNNWYDITWTNVRKDKMDGACGVDGSDEKCVHLMGKPDCKRFLMRLVKH